MGLKLEGIPIMLDRERRMLFSLNVLEACVEKFGDVNALLQDSTKDITTSKWVACLMINEGTEVWNDQHPDDKMDYIDEAKLGRYVAGIGGIAEFNRKIKEAFLAGLPEDSVEQVEDQIEEAEKNLMAARNLNRAERRRKK